MTQQESLSCQWWSDQRVLYSRLCGKLDLQQIETWRNNLYSVLSALPQGYRFVFFLNEWGYDYCSPEVHALKKLVLPEFLASCGFFLNLLGEEANQQLKKSVKRDPQLRQCVAMVMNHHKVQIMADLNQSYGGPNEAYFSNEEQAIAWIKDLDADFADH